MNKILSHNTKGFTLIEMLVVIGIIGLLSAVVVVGLAPARESARDSRRIADINQIQNALEIDYSPANGYADSLEDLEGRIGGISLVDPQGNNYGYETFDGGFQYRLGINLERDDFDEKSADTCPGSVNMNDSAFCVSSQ